MESSHQIFCGFAAETASIVESSDGFAAAIFNPNTLPTPMKLCGYMNAPQTDRGMNNSLGYSISSPGAAYRKRGTRNPTLSVQLRGGGALDLLTMANRASDGRLPWLCFFVGVPNVWTDVYRFCKIGDLNLQAKEASKGEAAEIEVTLKVEATTMVPLGSALNPDLATLRSALDAPLFWHDVRTFTINGPAGDANSPHKMRRAVSSFSAQINHNLERKNERNDFGDNSPLSNTSYDLLEHNINVSGEIGLHERLDERLLTMASRAQNWGNIEIAIGDLEKTQQILLTLVEAFPQNYTSEGVEAGAQLSHSVAYMAKNYSLTAGVPPSSP